MTMIDPAHDRQRRAEALANAQIPGLESKVEKTVKPKRDVINVNPAHEKPSDSEIEQITNDVISQLKSVYDPEIPVDIYELGLIYKVDISDDRDVTIDMTLTAPGCPVAEHMPRWVEDAVRSVDGVGDVVVNMTFEPPWDPSRMSDEARVALNMF